MTTEIAEYSPTEAALADLRQRYGKVVFDVTTTKGMDLARKGRSEIKGYRVALEAKRVEIKAPALERCRMIDAEAKRITAELVALEDPIDALIKTEEQRKEREKAEKERIERERIESIQLRIAAISAEPGVLAGLPAAALAEAIMLAEVEEIDDSFAEFKPQALIAQHNALAKMREMHAAAVAQEAEQARLIAEREELARLRAEQEQREAQERARVAAQAKADAEARAKIEAEERAARERIEAQERAARAAIDADQAEARKRQAEEDARLKAERDRIEAERREVEARERKAREEAEAKARAEREAKEAQEREERRKQVELMDGMQMLETFVERFGKREEFKAVVKGIAGWLAKQKQPA
jgi:colicin import membrane protein